jgi:hypothetical protein
LKRHLRLSLSPFDVAKSWLAFTESVVEDTVLAWLENVGYAIKRGPEIAPDEFLAERTAVVAKNATVQLGKLGLGNCFREGNNWRDLLVG